MSLPTSHKLAPFLASFETNCETPIAGYASYLPPLTKGGGGDLGPIAFEKIPLNPPFPKGEERHLTNPADFLQEVLSRKFDQLLDLFCIDLESNLRLTYRFSNNQQKYPFQLSFDIPGNFHVPTLSSYYASAHWLERECFDLFGIRFENHPHLRRLLLYPEFAGHPLRKNYPIDKAQPLIPIYA